MKRISVQKIFEYTLLPYVTHLTNNPSLIAIRSALIVTLPFMLLGSLAELYVSFPLAAYRQSMLNLFGGEWQYYGHFLRDASFMILAPVMAFSVGYQLAVQHNKKYIRAFVSPLISALQAFAAYFCTIPSFDGMIESQWLGVAGLFVAIVVGMVSTKLFLFLFSFKRLRLHLLGDTADIAIPQNFNHLLPAVLTIFIIIGAHTLLVATFEKTLHELVSLVVRSPFTIQDAGLEQGIIYTTILQALWFVGIHGANMLASVTADFYVSTTYANETAAALGYPLPYIVTDTFMKAFVSLGGAGACLALIGAILLYSKASGTRKVAWFSLLPCLFNINEILLFGLPIVLNPLLIIPFLLTPVVLLVFSYFVTLVGFVPATSVEVDWTTPIFFSGYLSTGSWAGVLLQVLNLGLGILLYTPFVFLSNYVSNKQVYQAFQQLMTRACTTTDFAQRCTDYNDEAGTLARCLVADLEHALDENDELFLMFQPQIAAASGQVVSVEALVRWQHPAYGLIPAPIIIAVAEASELIKPLGLWVFEEACVTHKSWLECGLEHLKMGINVSTKQLEPRLAYAFTNIAQKHGLAPAQLVVEVTESGVIDGEKKESQVLAKIYDAGFAVAIDDFGMGHTSLNYLKEFPISCIKIDGSLSKEVLTNPICADIVASITNLCQARNMTNIVEFVENRAQAQALCDLGCEVMQGYLYSKPLLADECLTYILRTNKGVGLDALSSAT